ncbi:MAG: 5-formyltetrahydrofolate cyclo-ligase [Paraprevotella sp.]|nr:5-formyltetrahydrofolate cyclo-ligase [Paraprevotella sp.]
MTQYKKDTSPAARLDLSAPILRRLAVHPRFVNAQTVMLYHALPDEVDTRDFVRYWSFRNSILLPTVKGNEIELHRYTPEDSLSEGAFGVQESSGTVFTDYASIDLAVIPGVAFDAEGHRLGRGQGFYDRLLTHLKDYPIYKLGVCFDCQNVNLVPTEAHDVPMDEVL